jgi:chromosome segregation ATPase
VLYLAEVQKQKTGFIGAAKAEIKLLAFQRADQSWNPVQGEELIPAEEANNFNSGALVIADLNANRQVQRIQDAGRPLVSILQNFSRQLEKAKSQEEEIEQWKESLTYQSEEMNRRHMEMEARLEQLEQIEEEYNQLQSSSSQQGLDETTVSQVEELLARLSQGLTPTAAVQQELIVALQLVETQQATLNPHWQGLEEQKHAAEQQQAEVDNQAMMLQNGRQEWQLAQNALAKNNATLEVQITTLQSKQDYVQMLRTQLRDQEDLHQQLYCLIQPANDLIFNQQVDLEALEQMPLEQLQQVVQDLHRDWESASRFVHEQEEELRLKQQAIDELQVHLCRVSDADRINLETELADELDSYDFLHQTLVGQRQNLQERKETLRQHQSVLWQRQGISIGNRQEDYKLDLDPIISQVQMQKQQQMLALQKLEQEIEQMQSSIEQTRGKLDHQTREQETKWQELQSWEQNLLSLRAVTAEGWARLNLYQEMLRPIQDSLDGLRQKLQAIASVLEQSQESGDNQAAIAQIRQTLIRT